MYKSAVEISFNWYGCVWLLLNAFFTFIIIIIIII